MAAAGAGLRKSGKIRAKSSNQGWSPNSGQDAEHESASLVDVFVPSKVSSHLRAVSHYPQQLNQQAGTQTQHASSMNSAPIQRRLQCAPWTRTSQLGIMKLHLQEKTSTLTPSLTLTDSTLSAETMLHRDRTLLTPQMFRCLMLLQCMTLPLRDALLVEDAASGA